MASVVTSALDELLASLEGAAGGGIGGVLVKGAAGGLIGFAVSDLLKGLLSHPNAKSKVPRYAIIDLHNDSTIRFLSSRAVYRFLTTRRRRFRSRSPKVAVVPAGAELVTVR